MSKSFLRKLKADFIFNSNYPNENYELNTDVFPNITEKPAPLTKEVFERKPGTVHD